MGTFLLFLLFPCLFDEHLFFHHEAVTINVIFFVINQSGGRRMKLFETNSNYATIWKRMFSSYLLIIFLSFLIYSGAVFGESILAVRKIQEDTGKLYANTIASLLEERIQAARSLSLGIDASSNFKDLYYSQFTGQDVGTFQRYQLLAELRRLYSSSKRLDLIQVAVFLNGETEVFTSSNLVILSRNFVVPETWSTLQYTSVGEAVGLDQTDKANFTTTGLVCVVSYAHSGIGTNGCIAVVFDQNVFLRELSQVIGSEEYGLQFRENGQLLYQSGNMSGAQYSAVLNGFSNIQVDLYLPGQTLLADVLARIRVPMICALLLAAAFLGMAYFFSQKYYGPISKIGDMVDPQPEYAPDADSIVSGVRNLLGERDTYRKRIDSISPYADQRILRDFLLGNAGSDSLLALRLPPVATEGWYCIAAVYITWGTSHRNGGDTQNQVLLQQKYAELGNAFNTDDLRVWGYVSNQYLAFLILNSSKEIPSTLFYSIQEWMEKNPIAPGCQFTFGISNSRQGCSEIARDCQRTVRAVNDGILMCGRGEIYVAEEEENACTHANYYFPPDLDVTISHCIRHQEPERMAHILHTIYEKNVLRPHMDAETVRILVEELRVSVMRGLHDARGNDAPSTLPREEEGSTLEEIFLHYQNLLQQQIREAAEIQTDDPAQKLFNEVETRLYDPELSLKGLSAQFSVSEKTILQLFKKKYGETFLQYLQRRRIEHARTLLSDTKLTVSEIALQCGYTSDQSFRRNFIQSTSLTPGQYRSQSEPKKSSE